MEFDVLVIGGGPAGLAAAIRAKQVAQAKGQELSVCVVEKGAEIGAHILSGNVFEPRALDELFPDWKEMGAPLDTPVVSDSMYWLPNGKYAVPFPNVVMHMAPQMRQHGNYVISLGQLCRWLAEQAEAMEIDIFPGFAANSPVFGEAGEVVGVQLQDVGIAKDGAQKDTYEPGMQLLGRQTILAEGCRGSLSESIMEHFDLRKDAAPQHYGLGIKEVWEIQPENHVAGTVTHTVGWPLNHWTYGGSFIYHMNPNLLHIGMVVGLDYANPHMSPYREFQRFKHHPRVQALLEGGKCISYGARCLNEGGLQAIPKLTFPGGMLAGCSAGFLNVPKIKGSHTAMKTGMLAGEAAAEALLGSEDPPVEVVAYEEQVKASWVWEELKAVRNFKPAWHAGMWPGLAYGGATMIATRGKEPWTFRWSHKDSEYTKPAAKCKVIEYPKPDGVYSFEILENLIRSGVNHEHDQPAHLKVKEDRASIPLDESLPVFAGPEGRFCPAKVYEYVPDEEAGEDKMRLQINAQNCVHCKCCSIKTPQEFIKWTVPEGGGGPQYAEM
jgi:electron-transferring-flavoprotein dehydrogenase